MVSGHFGTYKGFGPTSPGSAVRDFFCPLVTMDKATVNSVEPLQLAFDHPLVASCVAATFCISALLAYRTLWHPLSAFPGPFLSAATFWYEFYYDVLRGGKYIFKIQDMHYKYGPIVRITPEELHCCDPAFIPELMPAGKNHRNKYRRQLRVFGFVEATGATADHNIHRPRRAAMSKMFSKESVRKLEPIMKGNLVTLQDRLERFQQSGEPISLLPMFGAFTNDTITQYAYGFNSNWLENEEFNAQFFHMVWRLPIENLIY